MARFKARARALDLLGRQQIAGIPTAINELFKNAHDAYADNVEIDYFRAQNLLILRDNGLGMTKIDFESRWLTLGTESKFTNRKTPPPPKDPQKVERPIMGEKGIGRLAIASIGNQVLILTKAKREGESHKIVAAFINWSIFELPGLNLEDVVVPIREFDNIPNLDDINLMKKELVDSLQVLVYNNDITKFEAAEISKKINEFLVSPEECFKNLPGKFSLSENSGGTHFYISPTNEMLNHDIDGDRESSEATKIEKMLSGFTNTMTPKHPRPLIDTAFRDYRGTDGQYIDLLDKDQFFTPEDFEMADHHFEGQFDEYGQFSGTIKIYKERTFNHKINWGANSYRPTECGSFRINFAYIQGTLRQSVVDSENHARISAKSDKFGGIYIYRDNIRILPYGNSDYDFIDIERNRTKSASYYFFSYRRMFGVVDITAQENYKLKEKAGREGFIESKAYRQLQDILKNFFVQLAADFFRDGSGGGPKAEFWTTKRAEREAFYKALQRKDQQSKVRKEKFQIALNAFFEKANNRIFESELEDVLQRQENKFAAIASISDPDLASQALIDLELESRKQIESFKQSVKVPQPKGFAVSRETRKDYEAYLDESHRIESRLIVNAFNHIDFLVNDYTTRLDIEISKRKRLELAVDFISAEAKRTAWGKEKEAKEALAEISSKVKELTNELMIDLENRIRDVKDRFKKLSIDSSEDFDLVNQRKSMEDEITTVKDRITGVLERVTRQLQGIYWSRNLDDGVITNDQMADAMAEELEELKERVHADIELSQLGLAVGVIHHEFSSTVTSIRGSIKDLRAWADVNENLEGVYKNLKINFEHLDGYLSLFTPLNRRLYRTREEIGGLEIKTFLIDLFKPRFERHDIQFRHTKGYAQTKIFGFRSTFYPVFVNVIDNAIYWLNQSNIDEKIIRLHADEDGIYISNNGPGIPVNDRQRVFELGFSRKRNGRGMGLHISREVLNSEKYEILLEEPREGSSVTFRIKKITSTGDE